MNKYDIILCLIILVIGIAIYNIYKIDDDRPKEAIVFYENNEILKIDLSDTSKRNYTVQGYNGDVLVETFDGKVRVVSEVSPKHLCSIQGYISNSYETIICLPNKIVIEIRDSMDIDTVVR